jgi:ribonuclease HI
MDPKVKVYVVWKGRKPGIYSTWKDCAAQVQGFAGAQYKAFPSRLAAERGFSVGHRPSARQPAPAIDWLLSIDPPLARSLSVDAACSGNPGKLEYQGVETATGKLIFHQGPFMHGTNNVGEFLAIVQALEWLKQNHLKLPVYSDSGTAISWVKKKACNTQLAPDRYNVSLFDMISHAEDWLVVNAIHAPVLKWDTRAWGEIPADFSRK